MNFYVAANDEPSATFERIAKQVVPRGFGKSKTSAAFKKEARKMFNLAVTARPPRYYRNDHAT